MYGISQVLAPKTWLCNVRKGLKILPSVFVAESELLDPIKTRGTSVQLYHTFEDATRVVSSFNPTARAKLIVKPFKPVLPDPYHWTIQKC